MIDVLEYSRDAVLIGAGATAITDVAAIIAARLFGVTPPNYALVGRWLAHVAHGRFRHNAIAASSCVVGERVIGWSAHYAIGIAFAFVLLTIGGIDWIRRPTLSLALSVGIGSVAAPFLLMQPGMGAGIAASRTPHPAAARVRSIVTHAIFGIGLYVAGWAVKLMLTS